MIPAPGDYLRILPELVLAIFGMLVMLIDSLLPERTTTAEPWAWWR